MSFVDVIARKRDGQALSADAIDSFVDGATRGTVPDYQLSALLMAIVWRGMSAKETALLTDAMVRSERIASLRKQDPVLDAAIDALDLDLAD